MVLESLHRQAYEAKHDHGGHFSGKSTIVSLQKYYYWPGIVKDVQGWIKQCKWCALARDVFPTQRATMTCTDVAAPWEVVAMDYTVLEKSCDGFENVLVLTDMYTRFTIAIPTRN